MKEVNEKSVRERILQIEHDMHDIDGGISIREGFELACLRNLLPTMTTNSPNPVDGDVLALIKWIKAELLCSEDIGYTGNARKCMEIALAALTAEPYAYASRNMDIRKESQYFSASIFNNAWGYEYTLPLYTTPPAQLLRPVELPKSQRLDGNGYGYYFDMDDVFRALEKSGVPFKSQG